MAAGKRKQVKKYKFELTRSAIGGVGIVCFCIFLWMFLFGVWAGQSLLKPQILQGDDTVSVQDSVIHFDEQKKHRP